MNLNKKTSRIAGFWYLFVAIFGSFYTIFVESKLIVSGDAAATVHNILASDGLFRLCIMSNLITTFCFLLLANVLYKLFKSVDKDLTRLMVIFIMASVPGTFLQFLKFAPILLASKTAYLAVFEPVQLQALAMIFLDLEKLAHNITFIFYGLWLFPLGMLVFKSRSDFISKALGVLLMIGCFGYLAKFFEIFFSLNTDAVSSLWMNIAILAEVLCILWLFILGPKDKQPALIDVN